MQPPNSRSLKKNGDIWKAKVLPVTLTWSQHGTGRPAELGSLTKQGKALWATRGTSCCCWTPGEEHEPEAVCSCCCPRSKQAFSLGKARYTGCSEPDSTLGWHLVSLAQYTTFSLPIHPVLIPHHLTVTAKQTSRIQLVLGRNTRERYPNTYFFNYYTGTFASFVCLSSAPILDGKSPLTKRKLAQRLSHAAEFSEGICMQTRAMKLDLQSS